MKPQLLKLITITLLLNLSLTQTTNAQQNTQDPPFSDTQSHWAKAYIQKYYQNKTIAGYPDGTFRPDESINRAEAVKILIENLELDQQNITAAEPPFTDTPKDVWFSDYVRKSFQLGLIQGYADKTFRPAEPITRAQAAKIIVTGYIIKDIKPDTSVLKDFKDLDNQAWYIPYLAWAVEHKVVSGYQDSSIRPDNLVTRAEFLKILSETETLSPEPLEFSEYNTENLEKIAITLERGGCFGFCPIYELLIQGNGKVMYSGVKFVGTEGTQTKTITENQVRQILKEFEKARYFELNDTYDGADVTDMSTATTSLDTGSQDKRVIHYHGDFSTPAELTQLEDKIDQIVNSAEWTEYDNTSE